MLWSTVKSSKSAEKVNATKKKEGRIAILLWCPKVCETVISRVITAGQEFRFVFIWNVTPWLCFICISCYLMKVFWLSKNKIYSFGHYSCGFDLFSLSDPGEKVPGNSFLWGVFYGKCEGCVDRCCITGLIEGRSAVDCSHRFISREYSLPRGVSDIVGCDAPEKNT